MPGRVAEWGATLAQLRNSTGLSAAAVVSDLKVFGINLDRASIYAYEAGRVAAPDAAVVWGLARIYGVRLDELISTLVDVRATNRPGALDRTKRLAVLNRSKQLRPSSAELQVIERLRRLNSKARKACLDFIDFQLQRTASKGTRKQHPPS